VVSKRAWETYPLSYRAREVKTLAGWIRAGESGSIVGLAGTGKSNLLGFLSHQPQAMTQYLKGSPFKLATVFVDLNSLPGDDLATFYRVILRSLYEARVPLSASEQTLPNTVEMVYRKVEEKADPFLVQSALREVLLSFRETETCLVLMLDPFDRFCRATTTQVLNNLRGLRDSFKTILSYLVGLRHRLVYVRDPVDLGELYEILDTHVCWVGPMERDDARWVIAQVEEGIGKSFENDQVERLIDLTGGYPALLRAASLWLARVSPTPEPQTWAEALLVKPSIQNRLQEFWQCLTGEEQLTLSDLQASQKEETAAASQKSYHVACQQHDQVLARLQEKRICFLDEKDRWQIFSPLFAAHVGRQTSSGKIWWRKTDNAILRGNICLDDGLTPQDRKLLLFFLEHPHRILEKDELASTLWPEEEIFDRGVEDVRLHKAVSHLRGLLEAREDAPRYIQTVRGIGYRFFPEGAPGGQR
jgi:DNA-binding winged helix-turn-helix (wHTH) protein